MNDLNRRRKIMRLVAIGSYVLGLVLGAGLIYAKGAEPIPLALSVLATAIIGASCLVIGFRAPEWNQRNDSADGDSSKRELTSNTNISRWWTDAR